MSKEYIGRKEAILAVRHAWAKGLEPTQYIEQIPAADVIEKKHGCWISVRDRLPEDQVEVLVATRSKNGVRNIDKGYLAIDHFIHRGRAEVTHWMPLPEFPKEEK